MRKAVREAGQATSWVAPREDREAALQRFVAAALAPSPDNAFRADFVPFCRRIAFFGRFNALSQCLIKATVPGFPDFYQGSEFWQLALVDPDNRRPVAYAAREQMLKAFDGRRETDAPLAAELVRTAEDGRAKLFLIARALEARRRDPDLFLSGRYQALAVEGAHAAHVVAFAREAGGRRAVVIVPRFLASLVQETELPLGPGVWQDTAVRLPPGTTGRWRDAFTGRIGRGDGSLMVGGVLSHFPVALLIGEEAP
jgi:(1->4)-alpha-D-glucan 1-alpha-D-glucosylmutase